MLETVHLLSTLCLHDSCARRSTFNVEASKTPLYSSQHAEHDMVNICITLRSHGFRTRQPSFNVEGGMKAVYCKQHGDAVFVDVHS